MESGVTLFWDTFFADKYDSNRAWPTGGYQVMLEFFLESNAAVDANPSFSPDGTKITFTSERAGQRDIWAVDAPPASSPTTPAAAPK